jgi:hypothetical protein
MNTRLSYWPRGSSWRRHLPAPTPVKLKFAVFSADTEHLYDTVKKPFAERLTPVPAARLKSSSIQRGAGPRAAAASADGPRRCRRYRLYRAAVLAPKERASPPIFLRICGAHEPVSIQAFRWERGR